MSSTVSVIGAAVVDVYRLREKGINYGNLVLHGSKY